MTAVRIHFLDASAIIKLFLEEDRSDELRKYFIEYTNFRTTSLCFGETLGRFKSFYYSHGSIDEYLEASNELLAHVSGESIAVEDIDITSRNVFKEVENIVQKHSLDVSDAFQIYTLKQGIWPLLQGDSKPILITADRKLAQSARDEHLRVWDCLREPAP
jgi:predicted nucleic acid-binding protein